MLLTIARSSSAGCGGPVTSSCIRSSTHSLTSLKRDKNYIHGKNHFKWICMYRYYRINSLESIHCVPKIHRSQQFENITDQCSLNENISMPKLTTAGNMVHLSLTNYNIVVSKSLALVTVIIYLEICQNPTQRFYCIYKCHADTQYYMWEH